MPDSKEESLQDDEEIQFQLQIKAEMELEDELTHKEIEWSEQTLMFEDLHRQIRALDHAQDWANDLGLAAATPEMFEKTVRWLESQEKDAPPNTDSPSIS